MPSVAHWCHTQRTTSRAISSAVLHQGSPVQLGLGRLLRRTCARRHPTTAGMAAKADGDAVAAAAALPAFTAEEAQKKATDM